MIPPRFAMTDHDEMTGCTAWEPAARWTRPELDVVAEALGSTVERMAAAYVDLGRHLATTLGAAASALNAARSGKGRKPLHCGPPMYADPRLNR